MTPKLYLLFYSEFLFFELFNIHFFLLFDIDLEKKSIFVAVKN